MAGLPINAGTLLDLVQMGAIGLGVYEGYLWFTGAPSAIPNDPIIAFLRTIQLPQGYTNPCPTGYHLVGNTCTADNPITCPAGYHLVGSTCVADTPTTCPTGQALVNGVCTPITCPAGYHLVGNSCVADVPTTCPTGYQLVNGVCTPITCPAGQALVNGVCTPTTITCPVGQVLVNGVCTPSTDVTLPQVIITNPGAGAIANSVTVPVSGTAYDLQSGLKDVFVRVRPTGSLITTGYALAIPGAPGNYSNWSATVTLTSNGVSPTGQYDITALAHDNAGNAKQTTTVVTYSTTGPITCPTGQQLVNGVCVPITCPAGQQLVNGVCTPIGCPAGYQLVNGVCVPITCPAGQALVNGVCTPVTNPDVTLPQVIITSPVTGATIVGTNVVISGTASDTQSGVLDVFVRVRPTGSLITTGYLVANPGAPGNFATWSQTMNITSNGISPTNQYDITALAHDVAGNAKQTTIVVTYNPTPTTLTPAVTPDKLVYVTGEQMIITGTGFAPNEAVGCRYTAGGLLVLAQDVTANSSGGFVVNFTANGGGHVTCTGRTSGAVAQTPAITVNPAPPVTTDPGVYESTMNIATPPLGTVDNGQTIAYAPTIAPYPTIIAESNEPAQYQGDMIAAISINGGAFIAGTRVNTLSDQWRFTPTGWINGANTIRLRMTYITGYVKLGTFNVTVTGASAYTRAFAGAGMARTRIGQEYGARMRRRQVAPEIRIAI